jgi:hypothetical protein
VPPPAIKVAVPLVQILEVGPETVKGGLNNTLTVRVMIHPALPEETVYTVVAVGEKGTPLLIPPDQE